jgi:hypothetical protein
MADPAAPAADPKPGQNADGAQVTPAAAPPIADKDRNKAAIWVAVFSLVVFTGVTIALFFFAGTADPTWSHYIYLLNGIQAIAFAGAGFLFGKEVNRGRAEVAEQTAEQERQRADGATEQAQAGKALASQVRVKAAMASAGTAAGSSAAGSSEEPVLAGFPGSGSGGAPTAAASHLNELAEVANQLKL